MSVHIKSYLFTFFIILITSFSMKSQEIDVKINMLIANELLKENKKPAFKKLILSHQESSPEIPTNTLLMISLFQLEQINLTGKLPGYYHTNIQFDNDIPDSERKVINQKLIIYSNNLKSSGLLNIKATEQLQEKIKKNHFVHILQLLEAASLKVAYHDWIAPERLKPFTKQLKDEEIITESSYANLQKDIEKENLTSTIQLLDYFKNAVSLPAYQSNETTRAYLEKIHQKVATILPELAFTNFQYTIDKDELNSFDDYISYNVIISLEVDGIVYKQSSWITDELEIKSFKDFGVSEFYQIFNKVLIDKNSTLRLHLATGNTDNGVDMTEAIGIALLEEKQTQMFRHGNSYLKMSYETFENQLTSSEIKKAIKEYKKIGFFDHLQQEEIEKGIELVHQKEISSINDIITCFPKTTHSFDYELTNLENPYVEILKEYAMISHGHFQPTAIQSDFSLNYEIAELTFKIKNQEYSIPIKVNGDWVDDTFFPKLDRIIEKQKIHGAFYDLHSEVAVTIFLTPEQYNYSKEHKLFIFSGEWETTQD